MTIKEFNEKVRIGTVVKYNGREVIIEDINRREHTACFRLEYRTGWVRCSEFDMTDKAPAVLNPGKNKRRVLLTLNGVSRECDSMREAAKLSGRSSSFLTCLAQGKIKREAIKVKYLD